MLKLALAAVAALMSCATVHAQVRLNTAVLPGSRSVQTGEAATAFLSVINGAASVPVSNCRLEMAGIDGVDFDYWETDAANRPVGDANPQFSLAVREARSFVFSLSSAGAVSPRVTFPVVVCDEGSSARLEGLNSFEFSASTQAPPDIIPIAAAISGDGVVRVAQYEGRQAFSLAAVNVGGVDPFPGPPNAARMTVRPTFTRLPLPADLLICQTNSDGVCLAELAQEVTVAIGTEPVFFKVIADVQDFSGIPFFPDIARIGVEFFDRNGVRRGSTSLAAVSPATPWQDWTGTNWWNRADGPGNSPGGVWNAWYEPSDSPAYAGVLGVIREGAGGSRHTAGLVFGLEHRQLSDGTALALGAFFEIAAPAISSQPRTFAFDWTPPADHPLVTGEYRSHTYISGTIDHRDGTTTRFRAVFDPINQAIYDAHQQPGKFQIIQPETGAVIGSWQQTWDFNAQFDVTLALPGVPQAMRTRHGSNHYDSQVGQVRMYSRGPNDPNPFHFSVARAYLLGSFEQEVLVRNFGRPGNPVFGYALMQRHHFHSSSLYEYHYFPIRPVQ